MQTAVTMSLDRVQDDVVRSGLHFLLGQYREGLSDVADSVRVPCELELSTSGDVPGDVFQRALLVSVLQVADETLGGALAPLIAAELDYLLVQRRADGRGWSYCPELVEMPPDADDLGMVTLALLGDGRRDAADRHCEPALRLLAERCATGAGGLMTWMVPPEERGDDGSLPPP